MNYCRAGIRRHNVALPHLLVFVVNDEKYLQGQKLEAKGANTAGSSDMAGENPKVFNFWGVANALADSVKKTTADISARFFALSFCPILELYSCM